MEHTAVVNLSGMDKTRTINAILAENIDRLMAEAGLSDRDVASKYGCEENLIYRLRTGSKPAGKESIVKLAGILQRQDIDFYIPRELEGKTRVVQRGRYIPVFNAITGPPKDYTDKGYPVGISDRQELAETRDPNAFYVEAEGDSMIGDDIREGDLLLVEPNKEAREGDIVFCRNDNGVTVKRFFRGPDHIELRPMNPAYPSIFIRGGNVVLFPVTKIVRDPRAKRTRKRK